MDRSLTQWTMERGARAKALREMMGPQRVERQKGGLLEAQKKPPGKAVAFASQQKKVPFCRYFACV